MTTLVGQRAPDFTAGAILSNGEMIAQYHMHEQIRDKYALILFYPLDFTFVCPTELIALHNRMDQFKKRNVEVIGVSVDSPFTHFAWRNTPVDQGGIGHVHFTLVGDVQHKICQAYGVEHPEAGVAYRASILIDKKGKVRVHMVNDLPLGRNIGEILRLFDAIEHAEVNGEVCPAGWEKGKQGIMATRESTAQYLAEYAEEL
jgi:peroxiredoxin 2/4